MLNYFSNTVVKQPKTVNKVILIIGCYFVLIFNMTFLLKSYESVFSLDNYNVIFLLSIPILLLNLMVIFFSLFSTKYLLKPALIFFTLLSSFISYATLHYGIVFDYGMIENSIETNSTEALSYVNFNAILMFFLFSVFPLLYTFKVNINYQSFNHEIIQRVKMIFLSILSILVIAFFFYENYASVGRNNRELTSYIVPLKTVVNSYKYVRNNYFSEKSEFKVLDNHPTLLTHNQKEKNVIVMVVGETARAENFSLNGYNQPTNQFTKEYALLSFQHMSSCGTATAVSVPCMFSSLEKEHYNKQEAANQQNLLDIAKQADVDVLWIDNNSGCKGVCKRVATINTNKDKANKLCDGDYCFDEVLLMPLQHKLDNLTHQTTLIVLHLIGSHGPTYYRRYPTKFAKFLPDCQQSDIQNCSHEQLVNSYDNTIAYTDYVISKMLDDLTILEDNSDIKTSMLYVSDHGESLGENGLYLHGFPYALAPSQQTHIPMLFWEKQHNILNSGCSNYLTDKIVNHDNIFHSLLGLMEVNSKVYKPELDIFSQCKNNNLLASNNVHSID